MPYDQNVNMNDVYAPAQTNIIIRSQSERNVTASDILSSKQARERAISNHQRVDLEKFTGLLRNITLQTSTQKCAKSIRIGLESAGARFKSHPVAAADWGKTLTSIGYRKINLSFDQPKKGDIYIIDRTAKNRYGHIAAYSGNGWVSDFKQSGYAVYRNQNVNYSYYRMD